MSKLYLILLISSTVDLTAFGSDDSMLNTNLHALTVKICGSDAVLDSSPDNKKNLKAIEQAWNNNQRYKFMPFLGGMIAGAGVMYFGQKCLSSKICQSLLENCHKTKP